MKHKVLSLIALAMLVLVDAQAQGFSMANSSYHAPETKTVELKDGSTFTGKVLNGKLMDGVVVRPDGTKIHCGFVDGQISGLCFSEYTDGTWYYGMWRDGRKHGEGSYFNGKIYMDMVYDNGTLVSKTVVSTPKYSKAGYNNLQEQKLQVVQEGLRDGERYITTESQSSRRNSGSVNRKSSSNQRQCNVCNGSGKCNRCNGKGYYTAIGIGSGKHHLCPSCKHTGRCSSCKGTGRR
jgi:hypothetical protein